MVDGLFRSSATERDRARRQLLGLTAAAGVAAVTAAGGLCVALAPADAAQGSDARAREAAEQARQAAARLQAARTDRARAEAEAAMRQAAQREAAARAAAQQDPVATSGAS